MLIDGLDGHKGEVKLACPDCGKERWVSTRSTRKACFTGACLGCALKRNALNRKEPDSPEHRFWKYVIVTDGCWEWIGEKNNKGYGRFKVNKTIHIVAHRFAYELLVGPIPDGRLLDHLCRNRVCVNPAHLEPVTNEENCRRGDTGKHNLLKTHCPAGHPYDEANTRIRDGNRECLACNHIWTNRYRAKQRQEREKEGKS